MDMDEDDTALNLSAFITRPTSEDESMEDYSNNSNDNEQDMDMTSRLSRRIFSVSVLSPVPVVNLLQRYPRITPSRATSLSSNLTLRKQLPLHFFFLHRYWFITTHRIHSADGLSTTSPFRPSICYSLRRYTLRGSAL
jgi:hypothetical protein